MDLNSRVYTLVDLILIGKLLSTGGCRWVHVGALQVVVEVVVDSTLTS